MSVLPLLVALAVAEVPVAVKVEVPEAAGELPLDPVQLVVTPVSGAGALPPARREVLAGSGQGHGTVRNGVVYRLEVLATGWWAAPVMLWPGEAGLPIVVPLWPTATLVLPWGGDAPSVGSVEVGFTSTGTLGAGVLPTHQQTCEPNGKAGAAPCPPSCAMRA